MKINLTASVSLAQQMLYEAMRTELSDRFVIREILFLRKPGKGLMRSVKIEFSFVTSPDSGVIGMRHPTSKALAEVESRGGWWHPITIELLLPGKSKYKFVEGDLFHLQKI